MTIFLPEENYIDQTLWYVADVFSQSEVNHLLTLCDSHNKEDGQIGGGETKNKQIRDSKIFWLDKDDPRFSYIYSRVWWWIKKANNEIWKFDLSGFKDSIQYTEYAEEGHYDWHLDVRNHSFHRKLSISILLQHPKDGGEFKFMQGSAPTTVQLGVGQAVIFPSYFLHKVSQVNEGVRKSLVTWIAGKPFK